MARARKARSSVKRFHEQHGKGGSSKAPKGGESHDASSYPNRARRKPRRSAANLQKPFWPKIPTIMSNWTLSTLLAGLHEDIEQKLKTARKAFGHAPTKGDASEHVWLELLNYYLPKRYSAAKAH